MFCTPGLVFGGTGGVRSRFLVLRSPNHFRLYRVRRVPFSCFARLDSLSAVPRASGPVSYFARPDSFSAVPRASGPVLMFCTPGLIFVGTWGVGSRFHVLPAQTYFRRYRGRPIPFSCFPLPDFFLEIPRASGPIFIFCTTELVFGGTEGVPSRFNVFRSRTCFRRY
jgi:hypothetical protein